MKLREHLHIIRRSIQLLDRLSRRNLLGRSLHALVVALMPYVPIYFSARLIDALIAGAPVQTLALYAGLTIGLTALLSLAKAFLLAQCEIGAPEMELAYEWMHAEKAAQLSYASIEDHEVARLKQRIRSETQTGFNLYYFYSSMERVIQFSVRILVSISLTASFFAADTIALPAKLLFAGGVVLTVAVNMLIGRRSAKIRSAFSADCVQSNIMLGELDGYITDYKPGKDIRLYAMEEPLAALDKRLLDELGAYEMRVYLKCAGLELIATVMNYALRFGVYLLLISGALLGGGYEIHTTLDTALQTHADALYADASLFPKNAADGTPVESAEHLTHMLTQSDGSDVQVDYWRDGKKRSAAIRSQATFRLTMRFWLLSSVVSL